MFCIKKCTYFKTSNYKLFFELGDEVQVKKLVKQGNYKIYFATNFLETNLYRAKFHKSILKKDWYILKGLFFQVVS